MYNIEIHVLHTYLLLSANISLSHFSEFLPCIASIKQSNLSLLTGIQGHKKKKNLFGENDSGCDEESDEYDNGAEHDYISGDSSE